MKHHPATTIADASTKPAGGPSNRQETAFDSGWTDTQRRIWTEEKAEAMEAWVRWVASYPGCPYAASAAAVLHKWAKRDA